jgi:hypothetical protein
MKVTVQKVIQSLIDRQLQCLMTDTLLMPDQMTDNHFLSQFDAQCFPLTTNKLCPITHAYL